MISCSKNELIYPPKNVLISSFTIFIPFHFFDNLSIRPLLRVIIPEHIDESQVERRESVDFIEPPVRAVVIPDQVSVGVVAERGVGGAFAVANLVIPALVHIKDHGAVSCGHCVADLITPRTVQRATTAAPIIHLPLLQIHVIGVITCNQGDAGWSVLALHVGD